jgi:hypothetical protein
MQDELSALEMLGITLPSPAYIVGVIVFSVIGMVAYFVGRRRHQSATRWIGLALMLYPYVVWSTWGVYVVGIALTAAAWFVSQREGGAGR